MPLRSELAAASFTPVARSSCRTRSSPGFSESRVTVAGYRWLGANATIRIAAPLVAQVSNLLYRRLPVGCSCPYPSACGLEIRDTADWKSALPSCGRSRLKRTHDIPNLTMNISAPFIRRPAGTSLLAIGLFLLGIVAYRFMPVAAIPRVDFPMINVSASLPGADPATIASSLAAPLERRLAQIAGVTEITSVSTLGGCSVAIQFDLNRKVDGAARDVQAAINAMSLIH